MENCEVVKNIVIMEIMMVIMLKTTTIVNCDDYDDDNDEAWTLQGEKWVAAASAQDFPSQKQPACSSSKWSS